MDTFPKLVQLVHALSWLPILTRNRTEAKVRSTPQLLTWYQSVSSETSSCRYDPNPKPKRPPPPLHLAAAAAVLHPTTAAAVVHRSRRHLYTTTTTAPPITSDRRCPTTTTTTSTTTTIYYDRRRRCDSPVTAVPTTS